MYMLRQLSEHQDRRPLRLAAIVSGAAIASLALVPAANAATAGSAPPHAPSGPVPRTISGCFVFDDGDDAAEAYCAGTSPSQFRIFIKCTGGQAEYGPWRTAGSGQTSYAMCGSPNSFVIDSQVETRN